MNGAGLRAAERERAAERVLLEMGIGARVIARGAGEIAAIQAEPADRARLTGPEAPAIAARVRSTGFRYVTIELASADADVPGGPDLPNDEVETSSG